MSEKIQTHNPYPRVRKDGLLSYRHRDMAAMKLGRALEAGETVHHDNGDKADWHPDNLIVFSSHRAHMLFENYLVREQQGVGHLYTVEEWLAWHGEWMRR